MPGRGNQSKTVPNSLNPVDEIDQAFFGSRFDAVFEYACVYCSTNLRTQFVRVLGIPKIEINFREDVSGIEKCGPLVTIL